MIRTAALISLLIFLAACQAPPPDPCPDDREGGIGGTGLDAPTSEIRCQSKPGASRA